MTTISALKDAAGIQDAVKFFIENKNKKYISHGEVLDGRASNFKEWSDDLESILNNEWSKKLSLTDNVNELGHHLIQAKKDKELVGLCYIEITNKNICIMNDLIVKSEFRNKNIGTDILNWTEKNLDGIKRVILESGINNEDAHRFFNKNGYEVVSKVMNKDLSQYLTKEM